MASIYFLIPKKLILQNVHITAKANSKWLDNNIKILK